MRIIGGSAKGRKLAGPKGDSGEIRPTSDRVRESLFNILGTLPDNAMVLDLFAGTGALGMEALSRGAKGAVFVDASRQALQLIHDNITTIFPDPQAALIQCRLETTKARRILSTHYGTTACFDLVFLDPPYQKNLAFPTLVLIDELEILRNKATIVVEEHSAISLPEHIGALRCSDRRIYGATAIWLFHNV